jgi:uncharacterized protein (UPF0262 family)
MSEGTRHRIGAVTLDEASLAAASANAEHERRVAVFDLVETNRFEIPEIDAGPYALTLSSEDGRLIFSINGADGAEVSQHQLPLTPFRRVIKDYFLVCDSYYAAIRDATPSQIEAIDMGRRGLHNEGAEMLADALQAKYKVDFETARRLFTLMCALYVRS